MVPDESILAGTQFLTVISREIYGTIFFDN
jgi:hypothetical protein